MPTKSIVVACVPVWETKKQGVQDARMVWKVIYALELVPRRDTFRVAAMTLIRSLQTMPELRGAKVAITRAILLGHIRNPVWEKRENAQRSQI